MDSPPPQELALALALDRAPTGTGTGQVTPPPLYLTLYQPLYLTIPGTPTIPNSIQATIPHYTWDPTIPNSIQATISHFTWAPPSPTQKQILKWTQKQTWKWTWKQTRKKFFFAFFFTFFWLFFFGFLGLSIFFILIGQITSVCDLKAPKWNSKDGTAWAVHLWRSRWRSFLRCFTHYFSVRLFTNLHTSHQSEILHFLVFFDSA